MMLISKIKNFHSLFTVLPDFTKLGNASKRAAGEKTSVIFGFRMKITF